MPRSCRNLRNPNETGYTKLNSPLMRDRANTRRAGGNDESWSRRSSRMTTPLLMTLAASQGWRKSRALSWCLFSFPLTLLLLLSSCGSEHSDTSAIVTARGLSPGTKVTVRGFVTVPSGLFATFTGEQGFAIEDSTGGIYVSLELA